MAVSGTSGGPLSINGIASGLDTDAIVESLLNIDRIPLQAVEKKETKANAQLTAWRSLNTRILALDTTLSGLTSEEMFSSRTAKSSSQEAVVATATSGKDLGNYEVTVNQLATRHQLISSNGSEFLDTTVGQGTVRVKVGAAVFDPITINSKNNTLEGLRDAINQAKVGVAAAILDSGEGAGANRYKLILNSNNTGTSAEIEITFDLDGGFEPSLVELTKAQDAKITVGSGANAVEVTSSSNSVKNFLPGLSLELLKANPDEKINLFLEPSRSVLKSQIQNMLTNYNGMASFFNEQFSYNKESETAGTLFGDTALLNFQSDLVREATGAHKNGGPYASLAQIGISLDDRGNLSISDGAALDAALENPDDLFKLLNDPDDGVLTKLKKVLGGATTTTTGLIASKETSIQGVLSDVHDKRLSILRYVDSREVLLRKQFTTMEQTLAALQSQSQQLAAQINGMLMSQLS